ncbi:TIM barrel protein [Mesorhizobium sp. B2-5-13]|uniref:hydroxypyruvate isomerase family protein n=1 Tax=unclassified Mesorhizobium TaxID=325217 RepID=UPI0011264301|nr:MULTISPECIES: TIM barrel protein [unclassified Mesorhizobium]TPJ88183.1 TIM barrel protein [Mesorhizobium sp. B2-5-13]TPK52378.1 TIM barrel protein [Mesorhizobium sp. B2-5-5]
MLRFSANLGFLWPDRPLVERIDAAAAAGFKAIELHWPYATPAELVRQRCIDHGLTLLGINTPLGDTGMGDFGLGAIDGRQSEFRRGFEMSADYARQAGATSIHAMAGVAAPDKGRQAKEVFIENLTFATNAAPDLTILLEPINQRDKPNYFYSSIEAAADIIDRVGAPNLRIMFDVYHVAISQGDVLTRLTRHLPLIGHVQIAAVPSRVEPDEGEVQYTAIFAALEHLSYAGWVGCEYKPRATTDDGLAWAKTLGVEL